MNYTTWKKNNSKNVKKSIDSPKYFNYSMNSSNNSNWKENYPDIQRKAKSHKIKPSTGFGNTRRIEYDRLHVGNRKRVTTRGITPEACGGLENHGGRNYFNNSSGKN